MKRYQEYVDEISADEIYEALLAYGMFSENLPPFLTSQSFFDYCQDTSLSFADKPRQFVYYENIRNVNIPRPLAIPVPMNYQKLCRCLRDNWDKIQEHFAKVTETRSIRLVEYILENCMDKRRCSR